MSTETLEIVNTILDWVTAIGILYIITSIFRGQRHLMDMTKSAHTRINLLESREMERAMKKLDKAMEGSKE
ncbi:MAG: hypothetical protein KAQ85_02295 [Thermodesulfovibrionia bacterium]|nr:hypothetical protein [Thermodesulfovibrionia bacterium]